MDSLEEPDSSITNTPPDMATQSQTLVTPVTRGRRRLSLRTISPPQQRFRITLTGIEVKANLSANDFAARHAFEEDHTVEIPDILESKETLEFMGFTSSAAQFLFINHVRASGDHPDLDQGLLAHVVDHIKVSSALDCTSADDDWDTAMCQIGIKTELREAIMLPEFSHLRFTAPLKFWLIECMTHTYQTLESLDERVRAGLPALFEASDSQADSPAPRPTAAVPVLRTRTVRSLTASSSQLAQSSETLLAASSSVAADETPGDASAAVVATVPADIPEHTILYRGTSMILAEQLYDASSGKFDLSSNNSAAGDFCGRGVCYWSPQRETADQYAHWGKKKSTLTRYAVVRVAVPNSFINSLTTENLVNNGEPSDDWRKVVWAGRRGKKWPPEMKAREKKADLITGHILSGLNCKYIKLKDYTGIRTSDRMFIKIAGQRVSALQWVFKHSATIEEFEQVCMGKGHIFDVGTYKVYHDDTFGPYQSYV